ncbi:MAG: hypothetical protein ABI670_01200 [Chloroflexota bacterium]
MITRAYIDETLLLEYTKQFYGYGTYAASLWFVGMEEGGGKSIDENIRRIVGWANRGKHELEDPATSPRGIGPDRWFGERPRIQTTWGKLIRILFAAEGKKPITPDAVKAYQRDILGRSDSDSCLLELLPLPSPSTAHWTYEGLTTLPHLVTRDKYREYLAPMRAQHIAAKVAQYQPKAVVFYSFDRWYRQWWQLIAGVPFAEIETEEGSMYLAGNSRTRFAIIKHPASMGLTNNYFHLVGGMLHEHTR